MDVGSIFYWQNVFGNNTYFTYTKMGGRTHSAVPLRLRLQIYKKEPVFAGSYMHSNLRGIFDEKRLDEIF